MTLERGSVLNKRYRIVEILGQGGMASIYRAVDENLGVDVAVKENLFTTEEYARQFRLEAVILANMRHTNLPRVTDHFVIDGQGQYLVMDYIEGEDLRQRMDRLGSLTEDEVIVIGVAICEALTYMHTRTPPVLHRDIKPGNVKITPQGHIYLVDFGLAKVVQRGQATTTGARAMTPGYSPPEQYGTARTDQRTDVYSLGATLYSALTDALPEDGLARAMDQTVLTPVRNRNLKISKRMATVIEKALEVRPDNRYQTADDMKQALLSARSTAQRKTPLDLSLTPPPPEEDEPVEAVQAAASAGRLDPDSLPLSLPPSTPLFEVADLSRLDHRRRNGRRGLWLAVAFIALLFTTGTASILFNPGWSSRFLAFVGQPATPTPTLMATEPVVISTSTPTVTPSPEPTDVPPTPTATLKPTVTPTPVPPASPTPEPTSTGGGPGQIAFASDRTGIPEIWLVNLDGSGLRMLTDFPEGACQPDWSPDGLRLVFTSPCPGSQEIYSGSGLFIINADGSGIQPLPTVPGGDYDPAWSPDGRHIAFTSTRWQTLPQIFIIDLLTNEVTMLPDIEGKVNAYPVWSPDGKRIAYVGSRGQVRSMNTDGSDRLLLSMVLEGSFMGRSPIWSPDGTVIIFTQYYEGVAGAPWLAMIDALEGSLSSKIGSTEQPAADASFSPDGYWIVFQSWPDGTNHDLYMMQISGVGRRQITNGPAYDFDPDWRPQPAAP